MKSTNIDVGLEQDTKLNWISHYGADQSSGETNTDTIKKLFIDW